ncbi:hypothetical protein M1K46_24500 [Fictibacillus sp. WQ 8-8]|nr:hypothetical protein [Fictibacillus sp. WQ 8-8]
MDNISTNEYENLQVETVLNRNKDCRYSIKRIWNNQKDGRTSATGFWMSLV